MSADNGIYIAKFPDGYRVCYAQAIENCWYYPPNTNARKEKLKRYFGESPIFETQEKAEKYAFDMYHQMKKTKKKMDYLVFSF